MGQHITYYVQTFHDALVHSRRICLPILGFVSSRIKNKFHGSGSLCAMFTCIWMLCTKRVSCHRYIARKDEANMKDSKSSRSLLSGTPLVPYSSTRKFRCCFPYYSLRFCTTWRKAYLCWVPVERCSCPWDVEPGKCVKHESLAIQRSQVLVLRYITGEDDSPVFLYCFHPGFLLMRVLYSMRSFVCACIQVELSVNKPRASALPHLQPIKSIHRAA